MNKNELRNYVIKIDDYKDFRVIHNILYSEKENMETLITELSRSHFLEFPLYLAHDSKRWFYTSYEKTLPQNNFTTSKDFIRIMKLSKILEN